MVYNVVLQKQQVSITTCCKNNITAKRIDPDSPGRQKTLRNGKHTKRNKTDKMLHSHIMP